MMAITFSMNTKQANSRGVFTTTRITTNSHQRNQIHRQDCERQYVVNEFQDFKIFLYKYKNILNQNLKSKVKLFIETISDAGIRCLTIESD